jgi:hypothetical protein
MIFRVLLVLKEGKNVAAIKHCVECDENLCQKCLGDHNKFSVMRGHQLLDTVKQLSGKKQELPSQRCERHGGKLIDVYCPGHDKVGCSTCMTIEHRFEKFYFRFRCIDKKINLTQDPTRKNKYLID